MANTEAVFSPEDLGKNVLSLETLTSYLTGIILDIRKNTSSYIALKESLEKMKNYDNALSNSSNLQTLFTVYEELQKTSLELRKALSKFLPEMDIYDNITYAFYYNGQRYYVENLNTKWLVKSSSSGELRLKMNLMEEEFKTSMKEEERNELQAAFNRHYATFLNAIYGTYRGIIGRGGALNVGHIAEAYESHNIEHHPSEYNLISGVFNSSDNIPVINKALIAYDVQSEAVKYWAEHEGIEAAWRHIRDALGTQRGTVAGDVGRMQVKQGKTGAAKIRLARLNTLIEGVSSYCDIVSDKPAEVVALRIAKYMSEPVRKMSATIISSIADEKIRAEMQALNDTIDKIEGTLISI